MDNLNGIDQELNNISRETLSKLSKEEISQKAKKYRKTTIITSCILGGFLGLLFIIFFCCLPLITEGDPLPAGSIVFFVIVALILTGSPFLDVLLIFKKSDEELAVKAMRKESYGKLKQNLQEQRVLDSDFTISKTIPIVTNGWSTTELLIDNINKKFVYRNGTIYSKARKFSDIINYEVYENGKSCVKGSAGSALVGGVFFGLTGLIVGSNVSRNINEECNQLKLIIRINDFNCPQIVINYAYNAALSKSSTTYNNMKDNLQSVCSMLEYMINKRTLEQSSMLKQEVVTPKSDKEQLTELKEMLDDGLITQEDFEKKKKQILGL